MDMLAVAPTLACSPAPALLRFCMPVAMHWEHYTFDLLCVQWLEKEETWSREQVDEYELGAEPRNKMMVTFKTSLCLQAFGIPSLQPYFQPFKRLSVSAEEQVLDTIVLHISWQYTFAF